MNKQSYIIRSATKDQIDYISNTYWRRTVAWQQNRYRYHIYAATDDAGALLGYLVLDEKEMPVPPYGKDWFIVTIVVLKECRRCGIGSALLAHAFSEARKRGIVHFQGSANPTKEAHGFWSKNGFVFLKFGSAHRDASKPKEYGNHSHMIFRRVDPIDPVTMRDRQKTKTDIPCGVTAASREQIDQIFETYIANACTSYVYGKREDAEILLAQDEKGEILAFLMYFDEALASPLIGKSRVWGYVYVKKEMRGQGLAKSLVRELLKRSEESIDQIIGVHPDETMIPLFVKWGFDVFITRYLMSFPNGKYSVGIGKRIKTGSLVKP